MDDAQPVPIPGITHDPTGGCLPPGPPGHHMPPGPPPPGHHGGLHHGPPPPPPGIIPPSHMSPLPPGPPPPHMDHPIPPPGGGGSPFFHGLPPAPQPKLGETNNNSMEKDLHSGKGDEDESVDGDAEGCKGEDSENKSPDDGAGGKRRGPRTTIKASGGGDESVKSSDRAKARRDRTSKDVNEYNDRFILPLSIKYNVHTQFNFVRDTFVQC